MDGIGEPTVPHQHPTDRMTITADLPISNTQVADSIASAVSEGLVSRRKWLPAWLFYDDEGSRLFDRITELPEYYLTRTERSILAARAGTIVGEAAQGELLRVVELGAGSADKTRLLLAAATARQGTVLYEPVDVSASALAEAKERIESEIPGVQVAPRVLDYTQGFELDPAVPGERRLVLYIGSSIGNFEPVEAARLLEGVYAGLAPGDTLLLGTDLVKDEATLLAAYNDAAGVTAAFNKNMLTRLNRELDADFDLDAFAHRAVWNTVHSRIEMHLESRIDQTVRLAVLDLDVDFAMGETIHTENSYKYLPGRPQAMIGAAGFSPIACWTDEQKRFAVSLGRVE